MELHTAVAVSVVAKEETRLGNRRDRPPSNNPSTNPTSQIVYLSSVTYLRPIEDSPPRSAREDPPETLIVSSNFPLVDVSVEVVPVGLPTDIHGEIHSSKGSMAVKMLRLMVETLAKNLIHPGRSSFDEAPVILHGCSGPAIDQLQELGPNSSDTNC